MTGRMDDFPLVECRGWKEIQRLLRVKCRQTAKKRLESLDLYQRDESGKPYVVVEAYKSAVMHRELDRIRRSK
jgi:hypothetical protein